MPSQTEKANRFGALHEAPGHFVIANAWDAGSARILAGLGFAAPARQSVPGLIPRSPALRTLLLDRADPLGPGRRNRRVSLQTFRSCRRGFAAPQYRVAVRRQ